MIVQLVSYQHNYDIILYPSYPQCYHEIDHVKKIHKIQAPVWYGQQFNNFLKKNEITLLYHDFFFFNKFRLAHRDHHCSFWVLNNHLLNHLIWNVTEIHFLLTNYSEQEREPQMPYALWSALFPLSSSCPRLHLKGSCISCRAGAGEIPKMRFPDLNPTLIPNCFPPCSLYQTRGATVI